MNWGFVIFSFFFPFGYKIPGFSLLFDNFNIKSSIQSAGTVKVQEPQYHIYIWKESMPLLRDIVSTYVHPSMKYKISK